MNEKLVDLVNDKNATFKMVDENGNETIMNTFEVIEMLNNDNKSLEKYILQLQEQNTILENKLNDIARQFKIYDWENSNEEQLKNQIKSLYESIFKGDNDE